MHRFVLGRVARLAAVLGIVTFLSASLLNLLPTDPAYVILGENATAEQVAQVRRQLNLDDPIYQRYFKWLGDGLRGDLGTSYVTGQPVLEAIVQRLPVTIELVVLSLTLALAVSLPIGIFAAYRADGRFDRFWQACSSLILSVPPFVAGVVLVLIFGIKLRNTPLAMPATGWVSLSESIPANLHHVALPVMTLALFEIPAFTRVLRAEMTATLQEDFILAAESRGLSTRRILLRHALRPSSFSLITVAGISLGRLIGGAIIVEIIFALPGLGQLLVAGIFRSDLIVVQGVVTLVAVAYVVINGFIDVVYGYVDPRVRIRSA